MLQLALLLSPIELHPRPLLPYILALLVLIEELYLESGLETDALLLGCRSRGLAQLYALAVFLVDQMEVLGLVPLTQKEVFAHLGVIFPEPLSFLLGEVRYLPWVGFQGSFHGNIRQQGLYR